MDILDDMWVSKLSAKVFLKVNYSFKLKKHKWKKKQKKKPTLDWIQIKINSMMQA